MVIIASSGVCGLATYLGKLPTEVGASGAYWTSSTEAAGKTWHREISTDSNVIIRTPVSEGHWLAVRCVQGPRR